MNLYPEIKRTGILLLVFELLSSFVFGSTASAEGNNLSDFRMQNGDRSNKGPNGYGDRNQNGGRMGGGNRGGGVQNDESIQTVLDENAGKFEQFTFDDPESGISLEYSLFIPEDTDDSALYPLLMYIPDSTGSGKSAKQIVEQYYGATVWVTPEDQEKHPAFVLVPAFSGTVVDDNWNTSKQIETAVHLINALKETYRIDPDRIYTTGQSMGCMTSLYLNSVYPDLFAASLFVSGQWDISVLDCLEKQNFSISRLVETQRLREASPRLWRCSIQTTWLMAMENGTLRIAKRNRMRQ